MTLLGLYLSAYLLLLAGAVVTLWRIGVFARLSVFWIGVAVVCAVAPALALVVASLTRSTPSEPDA